ncbi:MAG: PrgI family protein [Clostridia bacterium]|nr:PrgI family protein [Clostridia bacterium]
MEIKVNKEIKNYKESIFFGLSFRQFLCSVLAVGAAVGVYFGLSKFLDKETVSWLCIVCAAPIAVTGFFTYNGLNFEKFLWAVIKSEFLCSGVRLYKSRNFYNELFEEVKLNDRISKKKNDKLRRKGKVQNS